MGNKEKNRQTQYWSDGTPVGGHDHTSQDADMPKVIFKVLDLFHRGTPARAEDYKQGGVGNAGSYRPADPHSGSFIYTRKNK